MLLVDKPAGPTSHDVVGRARRALGQKRVGHAGTLDPPATGLLVVLVGRATRLMQFVSLLDKRYRGTVRFGFETTTDDAAGERTVADDGGAPPMDAAVDAALALVRERREQLPPPVSAKKVEGERAYQRARRGETVELTPVRVVIHRLERVGWAGGGDLEIDVACSAGTYVRAIARDVGRALGRRAHLAALRRTGIGPWDVGDALPLDDAFDGRAASRVRPMTEAVAHLPRLELDAALARRFRFGQRFEVPSAAGFVAVFEGDALLGVARVTDGVLQPEVGLAS